MNLQYKELKDTAINDCNETIELPRTSEIIYGRTQCSSGTWGAYLFPVQCIHWNIIF